jgi:hypothetical protein
MKAIQTEIYSYELFEEYIIVYILLEARGGAVVEALRYKPEGRGSIPDGVIGIFH